MWDVSLPPSAVGLSSHSHFYKLSCSNVAGWVPPLLPSLASLFIYSSVRDCPSLPSWLRVFVVVYSVWFFSVFSLGGGQSVQGAMLIWPRVVCGSTTCPLAHLVVCISQAGRSWHLVAQEPSWFLLYHGVGMLCVGWGCGGVRGVRVLPLLGSFSCKVYLQCLSKILL
jgi:hypothetical protein